MVEGGELRVDGKYSNSLGSASELSIRWRMSHAQGAIREGADGCARGPSGRAMRAPQKLSISLGRFLTMEGILPRRGAAKSTLPLDSEMVDRQTIVQNMAMMAIGNTFWVAADFNT